MNQNLQHLKELWKEENLLTAQLTASIEISLFQAEKNLIVPIDLLEYFLLLNGTNDHYDKNFFKLYGFNQFKCINDELKNWRGIPDYSDIVNTLQNSDKYFPLADYMIHMSSYVIRLYENETTKNEILVVCGDAYKQIASSFSEFIDLYLKDANELQF